MCNVKLFKQDIQPGVFVIRGHEARLITRVVDGLATYCKFSAKTGEPYGDQPAACMVKSLLTWAERLASPDEVASYDRDLIIVSSHRATEKWVAGLLALMPSEFLFAELDRRGILPGLTT